MLVIFLIKVGVHSICVKFHLDLPYGFYPIVIFIHLLLSNIEYPAQVWFTCEFYKQAIFVKI